MKKYILMAVALLSTLAINAQFEQGTKYVNANVTGLGLSFSQGAKVNFGIGAEGGYYVRDNWMIKANLELDHKHKRNDFTLGAGFRYHFSKNGIFVGAGLAYDYSYRGNDAVEITTQIPVETIVKNELGDVVNTTTNYIDYTITKTAPAEKFNSFCIPIEVGYTFYLNHHLAVEPSVYYKMSLNHFGDCSTVGLRLGLGYFF